MHRRKSEGAPGKGQKKRRHDSDHHDLLREGGYGVPGSGGQKLFASVRCQDLGHEHDVRTRLAVSADLAVWEGAQEISWCALSGLAVIDASRRNPL